MNHPLGKYVFLLSIFQIMKNIPTFPNTCLCVKLGRPMTTCQLAPVAAGYRVSGLSELTVETPEAPGGFRGGVSKVLLGGSSQDVVSG